MAHDFLISTGLEDKDPAGVFNGYAQGVFYNVFDVPEFNAGVSGSNEGKWISQKEADEGIKAALNSDAITNYPDPTRADDLKSFYKQHIENASSDENFYVHFS